MKRKITSWIILFIVFFSLMGGGVQAQTTSPDTVAQAKAIALLNTMTPEEKVGQLFLITFKNIVVSKNSQIYDLIVHYHIGGVVLLASNDNITSVGTVPNAYGLIGQLQEAEFQASQQNQTDPISGNPYTPAYIPLFIGMSQEGDSAPFDQIINGVTDLPNEMAIGATWDPSQAKKVGTVMGSELQAIGVNLFMGPSLDVLEMNQASGFNDLGTRTFGGDPFWVSEMGKAYIAGLHEGSNNRMAVISTHFPGAGAADRSPEEEVATVWKSLDQLNKTELAPFVAVTGNATSADETTDGLLVSHIRYQGFQGNIQSNTKPVSFDQSALTLLMGLDPFANWRKNGGLLVSDDLGSRAVRLFNDPTGNTFNAKQIAYNAFQAGNDLLYADNFVANGDPDAHATIISTLSFFAQKYREDAAFKASVDASVLRILTLKYHLYPNFKLVESVIPPNTEWPLVNTSQQVSFDVAQKAVTLISPAPGSLTSVLPKPPQLSDHIVFFTDALSAKQCTTCNPRDILPVDGLLNAVLKNYGPSASGQVSTQNLVAYSFADLQAFIDGKGEVPKTLQTDLGRAEWVVFSVLGIDLNRPETQALQNVLSLRPDLIRNKKVIVFAFNSPYSPYLDATNVSKLTAYYGLYSKGQYFLDVASRVLFQDLPPAGYLPVDVPAVGYKVLTATSPDPTQKIPLFPVVSGQPLPNFQTTTTPNPTVLPPYQIGDTISLQTGVILDHNQHPVPDGTLVQFSFTYGGDNSSTQQIPTVSKQGIASLSYRIDKSGTLQIGVSSGQAIQAANITLTIPAVPTPALPITMIAPTQEASLTPTRTPVPTFTVTPTTVVITLRSGKPYVGEWALVMLVIALGSALAFLLSYRLLNSMRWGVRWALCTAVCGLIVYIYLSSGFPAGVNWVQQAGTNGILGSTLLGIILGWAVGMIWWLVIRQTGDKSSPTSH